MTMRDTMAALLAGALLVTGGRAAAQQDEHAAAQAALQACIAAAEGGREQEARTAADRAEELFERWSKAAPRDPEPRVGMASVKSRCRIPFVEMMQKGVLIGQSNSLLEDALRLDSLHWGARFALAMNHYHTPAFLGRTGDAVRHLETLVAQQGERAEPHFALPYLFLGDLYRRQNREADARAIWERGARLFPADARFRERLAGRGEGSAAAPASGAASTQPTGDGQVSAAGRREGALTLAPVVADGGNRLDDTRSGTSLRRLDVLTTPGGTADVMHAFQTMPGATRAAEGSDLYVRGGDPAESPVFVDGARLVYPGRYESLNGAAFGILDSQVLRSAYFASGGFSVRYGDALSGVLDLETNGRPEARVVRLNGNTVQLGTAVDLPLGRRAGAWGSLRMTDASLLLALHGREKEFAEAPGSLEGMLGAVWTPRAGTELRLTAMADGDHAAREVDAYGWRGPFRSEGMNRLVALSGRTVSADGAWGLRGSLSAAVRENGYRYGVLDRERTDRGLRGRVEGDLAWGGGRLRAGAEAAWMDARQEGAVPTTDRLAPGSPARETLETADAWHAGAFVEAERPLGSSVALVAGVRADHLPGEGAWTMDPRLGLAVRADEWTLRLAGGLFHQGRWRTRYAVPDAGSPSGTPTEAAHLVVGAERGGEPSLKVEAFWKEYGAYQESGAGPRVVGGRAAGVDAMVRWSRQRRLNGWITYSFLDGRVELEDGREAPSAVDVRHTLTGVARLSVVDNWEVGSTLRLSSGRPFTEVVGPAADGGPVYGAPNGARLPSYARLDGRVTRYIPMRAGVGVVYLEMLNLLDRGNVQGYTYGAGYAERRPVPAFFADRTLVLGLGLTL